MSKRSGGAAGDPLVPPWHWSNGTYLALYPADSEGKSASSIQNGALCGRLHSEESKAFCLFEVRSVAAGLAAVLPVSDHCVNVFVSEDRQARPKAIDSHKIIQESIFHSVS